MKQTDALEILKTGCNVFLTGQAGAGKTYLLNQYIEYLRANHIPVAVTASTGIAATHMNGMTIHGWSGIGIKDSFEEVDFKRLEKRNIVVERLKNAQVLIIDEVSMLHKKQLDLVHEVLSRMRKDDSPFGGMQVIVSGDFFQLPPIGDKGETTKDKFAFMSDIWIKMANNTPSEIKVCYLTEQYRQSGDEETSEFGIGLNDILNQIRDKQIDTKTIQALNATKTQSVYENRTRLYTHNFNVDKINQEELDKLTGKTYEYTALTSGDDKLIETLKKTVRASEQLILKVGAKVMFVKNNPLEEFYNGTMGEVISFYKPEDDETEYPIVKLNNGKSIMVGYESWAVEDDDGTILADYSQIPLCLAWAITVHKSQGMTLEAAEIDLSKTFEAGQGYVALSRLKSLKGLKLLGLNDKALLLDEFASIANRRFLQLSDDAQRWLNEMNEETLHELQTQFAKKNNFFGADIIKTTNKANEANEADNGNLVFKKNNNQAKNINKQTDGTQAISKLILAKKSLAEIKQETHSSVASIIDEMAKLIQDKELKLEDIHYLSPSSDVLSKVKTAYNTLNTSGAFADGMKVNLVFDELGEKGIARDEVRLALVLLGVK